MAGFRNFQSRHGRQIRPTFKMEELREMQQQLESEIKMTELSISQTETQLKQPHRQAQEVSAPPHRQLSMPVRHMAPTSMVPVQHTESLQHAPPAVGPSQTAPLPVVPTLRTEPVHRSMPVSQSAFVYKSAPPKYQATSTPLDVDRNTQEFGPVDSGSNDHLFLPGIATQRSKNDKSIRYDNPEYHYDQVLNQYMQEPNFVPPNFTPSEMIPESTKNKDESLLLRLADILTNKQDRLPKMKPEVYSGDLLKFPIWWNSFQALIENKTDDPSDRLFSKYTSGDAKACIQGYLTLYTNDAYVQARAILLSRYGDKVKVAQAYKKKLNNLTFLKGHDPDGLQKYADFLWQCDAAMRSVSYLSCQDSMEENKNMAKKLPQYVADRWSRTVDRLLYNPSRDSRCSLTIPIFQNFVCLFQMRLV